MRLLYAVQFEVGGLEGAPSVGLSTDVLKTVSSWISEWYSTRKAISISFPVTGGAISPVYNHDLSVTRGTSDGGKVSHTIVSWSYPDDNDGNLF